MVVDDEPEALSALLDALARRFGADYRVVSHLSARAALRELGRSGTTARRSRWSSRTSGCPR